MIGQTLIDIDKTTTGRDIVRVEKKPYFLLLKSVLAPAVMVLILIPFGCENRQTTPPAENRPMVDSTNRETPHDPYRARLSNAHLSMTVLLPDMEAGRYRGQRFDHSGMIESLTVDGTPFTGEWFVPGRDGLPMDPESHDQSAMGTAEEFGFRHPPGYAQAKVGEPFLKIGVGVLKRKQKWEYRFFETHEVVSLGEWQVETGPDQITFTHTLDAAGWSYLYTKTIELDPNAPAFTIRRSLKNTGKQMISTDHYGHNFFRLGNHPIGPDYQIHLPFQPLPGKKLDKGWIVEDQTASPREKLQGYEAIFGDLIPQDDQLQPHELEIRHQPSGLAVKIEGDRPIRKGALFAMATVICAEAFTDVDVPPGQSMQWETTYRLVAPEK